MHDNVPVKERAKGRWYSILRYFNVNDSFLNKRNGPCPLCGGDDRYRWKDTDDRGEYYCNQCGPGDGFHLLMKIKGWTFPELANRIEEYLGDSKTTYKPKPKSDPAIAINKVIGESRAITPDEDPAFMDENLDMCPEFHLEFDNPDYRFLSWDMEPGDVIVHHPLAVHGSGKNNSASLRRVAVSTRYYGGDAVWFNRKTGFAIPGALESGEMEPGVMPVNDEVFPIAWSA